MISPASAGQALVTLILIAALLFLGVWWIWFLLCAWLDDGEPNEAPREPEPWPEDAELDQALENFASQFRRDWCAWCRTEGRAEGCEGGCRMAER